MPRNAGECKIRPTPRDHLILIDLPNTTVVWNVRDTANSSINRVQRFPKQQLQSQDSHTHCFPVPAGEIPSVGTSCAHMSRQAKVLYSAGSLCHEDPHKFLWWCLPFQATDWVLIVGVNEVSGPVFGPGVIQNCASQCNHYSYKW